MVSTEGPLFFFLVQCTFLEDSCSSRCLLTLKAEIFLSILHRLQEGFSAFGEMWRKIRQVSHWKITSFFPNLGKTNPNLKGISFLFFKVRSRLKRGLKTTKSVMSSLSGLITNYFFSFFFICVCVCECMRTHILGFVSMGGQLAK